MNRRVVATIARKELRESFRDRRTLYLMILLPLLIYPLMLLSVAQVAVSQQEKLAAVASHVAVLGADESHPFVVALRATADTEVTLAPVGEGSGVEALNRLNVDAIIDLHDLPAAAPLDRSPLVRVFYQSVDEGSRQALDRVEPVLRAYGATLLHDRLEAAHLQDAFANPMQWRAVDRNAPEERGGFLLGSMLPFLIIINVLLGAYYPAIDLTAGERERGSIQTLFTAPVASNEIVAGKYLAVVCIALLSGTMNVVSLATLLGQNLLSQPGLASTLDMALPTEAFGTLAVVVVLLALFVSAMLLAVAVMARSFKEAQTYITPAYLLCIIPAIIAQLPGFHYSHAMALIPGVNVVLLMKQALVSGTDLTALVVVATLPEMVKT